VPIATRPEYFFFIDKYLKNRSLKQIHILEEELLGLCIFQALGPHACIHQRVIQFQLRPGSGLGFGSTRLKVVMPENVITRRVRRFTELWAGVKPTNKALRAFGNQVDTRSSQRIKL